MLRLNEGKEMRFGRHGYWRLRIGHGMVCFYFFSSTGYAALWGRLNLPKHLGTGCLLLSIKVLICNGFDTSKEKR